MMTRRDDMQTGKVSNRVTSILYTNYYRHNYCVQYALLIGLVGVRIHAHYNIIIFCFHRNSNHGFDNHKYLGCLSLPYMVDVVCTSVLSVAHPQ